MEKLPKSLRLQIGIFGRTNVGKSSFLNMIAGQDVAIVSSEPGTTTDVVEKVMEFRPVGPVVFLDTAGIDDHTSLASERLGRTAAVFRRADVFVVLTEEGQWGEYEKGLFEEAEKRCAQFAVVVNKTDAVPLSDGFRKLLLEYTPHVMSCSCLSAKDDDAAKTSMEAAIEAFREIMANCAGDTLPKHPQTLVSDLIPRGGLVVLVVPIDRGAPKGRLIVPQAQAIRDILDNGGLALTVREREYTTALLSSRKPDLVVCDSQVVKDVVAQTPADIPLTTFSILFARQKGDLGSAAQGAAVIGDLKDGDRVLIAEACSHHPTEDDIGRVKLPKWLKEYTGREIEIDVCSGRDYPEHLERYSLIIHCGACMLTRREMLLRSNEAVNSHVPITNYGMAISYMHGVFDRVMKPFDHGCFA